MRLSLALLSAAVAAVGGLAAGAGAPPVARSGAPIERPGSKAPPKKRSGAGALVRPGGLRIAVVSSLAKIRPTDPVRGARSIALRALRGECESAAIAIAAGSRARRVVPSLEGDLGAGVELRLHRVELVDLLRPSGPEGEAGRWPDPLIPAIDRYLGEARKAFPLEIPAGESRAILVEACIARDAGPGRREAKIALRFDEGSVPIPLALRIERAAIPASASLATTFGLSSRRAALGHYRRPGDPEEVLRLDALYRRALLHHRISAHGGTFDPPPFRRMEGRIEVDFRAYDRELAPFLDGSALPSGARMTTVELRTHPGLASDEERIAYWRQIVAHHRARGWEALLFHYVHDEPRREELPAIRERALLVKKADPSIRVLLTASLDPSLVGAVDLWTPNLNCLYVKRRADEWCAWRAPPAAYRRAQDRGALLWWYQSCSSHGCDDARTASRKDASSAYFRGWPSYVVDAPGTRARAMGWLAWSEGIGGELYWDTVHAYAPDGVPRDPWAPGGLWAFGGNGDGTLLYPGTPARIGGRRHVPIESLRLHHIRDGLEDYELLRLVAALPGGKAVARAAARRVAASPFQVRDDPAAIERARRTLLDRLAARSGE